MHLVELAVLVADVCSIQGDVLCSDCCTDDQEKNGEYVFHGGDIVKLV